MKTKVITLLILSVFVTMLAMTSVFAQETATDSTKACCTKIEKTACCKADSSKACCKSDSTKACKTEMKKCKEGCEKECCKKVEKKACKEGCDKPCCKKAVKKCADDCQKECCKKVEKKEEAKKE